METTTWLVFLIQLGRTRRKEEEPTDDLMLEMSTWATKLEEKDSVRVQLDRCIHGIVSPISWDVTPTTTVSIYIYNIHIMFTTYFCQEYSI